MSQLKNSFRQYILPALLAVAALAFVVKFFATRQVEAIVWSVMLGFAIGLFFVLRVPSRPKAQKPVEAD